jgi:general secretion pathway protein E
MDDRLPAEERGLGERLVRAGKLGPADLERALQLRKGPNERLAAVVVRLGLVSERDVAEALAAQLGLPLVGPRDYPDEPVLGARLSTKFLRQFRVLPLEADAGALAVAMADPLDDYAVKALELTGRLAVDRRVGVPSEIDAAFERLYATGKTQLARIVDDLGAPEEEGISDAEVAHLKDLASEAPVIRIVNLLIERAVEIKASDIHIEPFESELLVRYRVDGLLHDVEAPPARLAAAIVSRIKIMARIDIAERRLPQDGRIRLHVRGRNLDLRVSTLPTLHGESVVLRLLYRDDAVLDLAALGFTDQALEHFRAALRLPHGIILVTGPTGSGKTTTLYSALSLINERSRKILTVEDPVEYQLAGINQIQVKPAIGLTFARTLRAFLRQDPDVIMIGEMRDLETAEIAVQAALTGHLVLSTLHTNDAASSVTRLLDMGVEGYLVISVLSGVLAQRLVRNLCSHCRRPCTASEDLIQAARLAPLVGDGPLTLYEPVGCEQCRGTGYRGRTVIGEMLTLSEPIRSLVLRRAGAREIGAAAIAQGMRTMYEDGVRKAAAGVTSLDEVLRVTQVI